MRHKYQTRGIVLGRTPLGETSAFLSLLTEELGLVRARVQGVRRAGAKLASALPTFAESALVLVRGKEGWRVSGAVLEENWFTRLKAPPAHERASRVGGLILRLVAGESRDPGLYGIFRGFLAVLAAAPEAQHDAAEVVAALRIMRGLGLDAGELAGAPDEFSSIVLADAAENRRAYIARINRGLTASGL